VGEQKLEATRRVVRHHPTRQRASEDRAQRRDGAHHRRGREAGASEAVDERLKIAVSDLGHAEVPDRRQHSQAEVLLVGADC
jgi:hypothetical protein